MTQAVSIAQSGSNNTTFRNRIINGNMVIDQRNAGASVTATSSFPYSVDRWQVGGNVSSKFTVQQNAGSVTPPDGFRNYLGATSSSAYSVTSGDYFLIQQAIEGFNAADLGWGTSGAATVTVSFKVRSSLTGTFGGCINNSDNTRSYPFTYTISAANTWETKTVTIAGDTTGTWLTTNNNGLILRFGLGVGSTYSGTAGAWSGSTYLGATGATSVVGTSGATFYITGVQLEKGTTATPFEQRLYGTELALCQRYYQNIYIEYGSLALCRSGTAAALQPITLYQTMRAAPSVSFTSYTIGFAAYDGANRTTSSLSFVASSTNTIGLVVNGSGFTNGQAMFQYNASAVCAYASSEL